MIDYGCPRNSSICPIPQTPQGSGLTHITVEVPRGERRTFSFGGCSTDLGSELLESIKPVLVQALQKIFTQEEPQTGALPGHGIVFLEWPTGVLEYCVQKFKLNLTQVLINEKEK